MSIELLIIDYSTRLKAFFLILVSEKYVQWGVIID